jgi:HEAT repeat protein
MPRDPSYASELEYMTYGVPSAIHQHQIRLRNELSLDIASRLFPLYLEAMPRPNRPVQELQSHSTPSESSSFAWLRRNTSDRPVVVTGEAGSGKTTLLEAFADDCIKSGEVVFFLRMNMWTVQRPTVDQLTDRTLTSSDLRTYLRSNETWVLFDALDEVRGGPDAAIDDILALFVEFPAARVVVSCRTGQFPPWAAPRFTAAAIQPLRDADVTAILGEIQHSQFKNSLLEFGEALAGLHDLCRNPLMLAMTQELLLAGNDRVLQTASSGQLYNFFVDLLEERERHRRQSNEKMQAFFVGGINLRVLGYVAWRMTRDRRASISEVQLARWLEDMLREPQWADWWGDERPSVNTMLLALANRPPLKASAALTDSPGQVLSFLHLTFRDAFASRHLLDLSETLDGGIREILRDSLDTGNRSFWPAIILLAGIEPAAGRTVRVLMDLSFESRRGDLLLLALRAAAERWDTPSKDIGELTISILDAFKNWERAFDSDLMRSGRALIPRLDSDFPQRIRNDLEYFTSKYAGLIPRDMPELSVKALLNLLSDSNDEHVINALHSLARLQYQTPDIRSTVARQIEAYLSRWSGERFDQAVAALKDIGDPGSLSILRRIATDISARPRARAYATTGIAALGTYDEVKVLRELLLDTTFIYRDSASWALQMLARKDLAQGHPIVSQIIDILMLSLRTEAGNPSTKYVKGNILYSLGALGALKYRDQIVRFLDDETDPFVIEDGMLCLGALSEPIHADLFRKYLSHYDPGVRLKAAEALQRLQAYNRADANLIAADDYRIIRRIGHAMMSRLTSTNHDLDAAERRRLLVVDLLSRQPVRRTGVRCILKGTAEEADALLAIYQSQRYPMSSAPQVMGDGPVREIRLRTDDIPGLLARLRSEE